MMILTLTQTFVNLVSTGEFVAGNAQPGRSESYKYGGHVDTYASGRQRAITAQGEVGAFGFQLRYIPRSTVDTLRAWANSLVQVRTGRGSKFFGVYFETGIEEVPAIAGSWCTTDFDTFGAWHTSIVLNLVTFAEGV
jgi:hypothetical protein